MDDDEARKLRDELAAQLMQYQEVMNVISDAAKGMRAKLESEGWSPTMAEAVAGEWLMKMMRTT